MRKSEFDLTKPQRQSSLAIIIMFFWNIGLVIRSIGPVLIIALFSSKYFNWVIFLLAITVLFLLSIGITLLWFFRYSFRIDNQELIVEKGIFSRQKLIIPFDRIQNVSFTQNVLQQVLNVTALEVETAGSSKPEVKIVALSMPMASQLQGILLSKSKNTSELNPDKPIARRKTLVRLNVFSLIKIGITANHLGSAFFLVFILFGFAERIGELLNYDFYGNLYEILISISLNIFLVVFPFIVLVSIAFSIIRTFFRYFNLHVTKTENNIRVSHGLTKKKEKSLVTSKVQIFTWTTNFLRKRLNFGEISFSQAGFDDLNPDDKIVIPGCSFEERNQLLNELNLEFLLDGNQQFNKVHVFYFYQRLLVIGTFISLAFISAGIIFLNLMLTFCLLPIVWGLWYWWFWTYYKNLGFYFSDAVFIHRSGVYDIEHSQISWHKIQSVSYSRTPFLKRRKLMNISFHTAGGELTLPCVSEDIGFQLINFSLWKVETSKRKWM